MFKEIIVQSKLYGFKSIKIDEKYFDWLNRFTWHVIDSGHNFYAVTNYGSKEKRLSIRMHNLLFPNGQVVDHINGDGLDNRECNLRPTTQANNTRNRFKAKGSYSSKYKGVYFVDNKWKAAISFENKRIHLGTFLTEEAAATVYNINARILHKEYAKLNILEEVINYKDFQCNLSTTSKYKHIYYDKSRNNWALNYKGIRKRFETEELAYQYLMKAQNGLF